MRRFVIGLVKLISLIGSGFVTAIIYAGIIAVGMNVFVLVLPQFETQISTPIPNPYHFALFHFMQGLENGIGHFLFMFAPLGYFLFVFIFSGFILVKGLKIAGKTPTYIDRIIAKFTRQRSEVLQNQSEEK